MLEQLIIIISNLIFLLIGFWLGNMRPNAHIGKTIVNQTKKALLKSGAFEYPTQADIDYTESGEELVDKAREKLFKENFKP